MSRKKSFAAFWPEYLDAHRDPRTRAFHYLGTSLGVCSFIAFLITMNWPFLVAAPILGYGMAMPTPDLRGQSPQDLRASGAVLRQRFLHAVPLGDGTAARGTGAAAASGAARIGLNETEGSALFQRPLGSGIERSEGERVRADRPSVSVRVVGDSGSTSIWPEMMPPRAISIRP